MNLRRSGWLTLLACGLVVLARLAWPQQATPPGSPPPGVTPPGAGSQENVPPASDLGMGKGAPKVRTNPIVGEDRRLPDYTRSLPDYTRPSDVAAQREARQSMTSLPFFGYSFFEPARQVITARAAFLRRLLAPEALTNQPQTAPTAPVQAAADMPSSTELALLAAMTDAQKADLRERQRNGQLTEEEKQQYRWFLKLGASGAGASAGNAAQPTAPGVEVRRTADLFAGLSDAQKADIRQRYRENRLTQDELLRYAPLLAQEALPAQAAPGTPTPGLPTPGAPAPGMPGLGVPGSGAPAPGVPGSGVPVPGLPGPGAPAPGLPAPGTTAPGWPPPSMLNTPTNLQNLQGPAALPSALPDVDAFRQIADPLATVLQRVIPTAPSDYQVAGGDVLIVRYWSPTMEVREEKLTVDSAGAVDIPTVGRIVLRGQTTAQAEVTLRERLRGFYRNAEVSVQLKELRTMPVVVNGESFFPGTYQVPAVATAFNVLYATGGPTDDGTLRRIEVRRRGNVVATIDLYRFLLSGDQVDDIRLQPGDVLFIPPRMARVAVRGEVRRPALYELSEHEGLADALKFAGGINPSGVAQRVQVTTVKPGATRVLKEVDVTQKGAGQDVTLYDGDSVDVFSVRSRLANKVTIEGAVDQPGEYAITDHMTVADLVERARGLLDEAYTLRADLFRVNPDNTLALVPVELEKALGRDPAANLVLNRWDRLRIYTRSEVAWAGRHEVTVRGAVRNPGIYTRNENARIKDILQQAGGALPEAAEVVVLHQNADRTYSYDYADVAGVVGEDPKQNLLVRDQDILAVYRKDETRFTPEHTFEIRGEVTTPGMYPRGRGMRLGDALRLAGGLTPKAGTTVLLANARVDEGSKPIEATVSANGTEPVPNPELKDGDVIAVQGRGAYQEKPWVIMVNGEVQRPGPVLVTTGSMRLSEAIAAAGGLKPTAYPQGASFERRPELLASAGQRDVASAINRLNDLLNRNDYTRALGRAEVERLRAIGAAVKGSSLPTIPGLTNGSENAALPANVIGARPADRELVSPPRTLADSDLVPRTNVAVDVAAAVKKPKGDEDILMADGDVVTIPEYPTTVRVGGAVVDSRAVVYMPGMNLDYYISRAGGYAPDAAKDRIVVIRLGGGLLPARKVKNFEPGDLILVPTRVLAERMQSHTSEIDAFFRGLTSSAILYKLAESLLKL